MRAKLWLVSVALLQFNLAGMLMGFLTTPDCPLLFFWSLCLHEALIALTKDRRRWLSAGFFTGLGLLSKYTMLIIGPVFLLSLLVIDRKALKTRWPYAGGTVALFLFSLNLFWNFNNDWITFKFQLAHRFPSFSNIEHRITLPSAKEACENTLEYKLSENFFPDMDEDILLEEEDIDEGDNFFKRKLALFKEWVFRFPIFRIIATFSKKLQNILPGLPSLNSIPGLSFLLSQFAFWGGFLFLIFSNFFVRHRKYKYEKSLDSKAIKFLAISFILPLSIFFLISFFTFVEANWSLMYIVGACPFVALLIHKSSHRAIRIVIFSHLFIGLLLVFHSYEGFFSNGKARTRDRVLKETYGYSALADLLIKFPGIFYADRYQLVSMLNYYRPELNVGQWPGLHRYSEYSRLELKK